MPPKTKEAPLTLKPKRDISLYDDPFLIGIFGFRPYAIKGSSVNKMLFGILSGALHTPVGPFELIKNRRSVTHAVLAGAASGVARMIGIRTLPAALTGTFLTIF